jgi:hypothetical protein
MQELRHGEIESTILKVRSMRTLRRSAVAPEKLSPAELIVGFDRLAIACGALGYRPANYSWWSEMANPEPAPSCCWKRSPRAIKSASWIAANSSPVLSLLGSAVLDLIVALVAPVARQPDHRPARDGLALAP